MGSLEEEQLVQMVHDFIELDSPTVPIFSASSKSSGALSRSNKSHRYVTKLQEILGSGTSEAEAEILECVLKHMCRNTRDHEYEAEKTTSHRKRWLALRLRMDGYNASLCHTSWLTSSGCTAGEYEYIEIIVGDGIRVIVDIEFKPQFEVARPTPAYNQLTDSLPIIFVGRECQLMKIVSLLCSAAKQSLKERGLHLPPWRTDSYMHSKWLSVSSVSALTSDEDTHSNNKGIYITGSEVKQPNRSRGRLGGGSGCLSNMTINCC